MSDDKRALLKKRLESGQMRLQPLTFTQRELWETSPVSAGDVANHICCLIEVRGKVTVEDGRGALQRVLQRQEALRISFLPGKEGPLQVIREQGAATGFRYRELPPEQNTPEAFEKVAQEIFLEPFDMLQGPLYRVELVKRGPEDFVLVFAIHHAIGDGWTLGVFVQELCLSYIQHVRGDIEPWPPLAMTYSGWGAAERAVWTPAELQPRVAFWKKHLEGHHRLWDDKEGPDTAGGCPVRLVTHFPAELATATRELARRSGATLYSTLLAVFQVAFGQWAGVADVLVGSPVANRHKQAVNETIGSFAGIVPVRGRVNLERTVIETLRAVHHVAMDCFAHAMPFVELARALGDPGRPGHNPIFEVRFALQNHPVPDVKLPGLSARVRMRSTGTARFHLACEITEDGDLFEVVWLFRPSLFSQADVEKLGDLFKALLTAACRTPESRLADLNLES